MRIRSQSGHLCYHVREHRLASRGRDLPCYASGYMNCTIRINFKVILLLDISGYLQEESYASVLG